MLGRSAHTVACSCARRCLAIIAVATSLGACVEQLEVEGRPCPCSRGWTCDTSLGLPGRCVQTGPERRGPDVMPYHRDTGFGYSVDFFGIHDTGLADSNGAFWHRDASVAYFNDGAETDAGYGDRGEPLGFDAAALPAPKQCSPPSSGEAMPPGVRWEGYIENFSFASGSDRIALRVHGSGMETSGSIIFGDASRTVEPVCDTNYGYPADFDVRSLRRQLLPHEGHRFTLLEANQGSDRLQFEISPWQLWQDWCQGQSELFRSRSGDRYSCAPDNLVRYSSNRCLFVEPSSGAVKLFDCQKATLCGEYSATPACSCSSSGCAANSHSTLRFDVRITNSQMSGSVNIHGTLHSVYLTRQDPS